VVAAVRGPSVVHPDAAQVTVGEAVAREPSIVHRDAAQLSALA
jgi:hypothetical protein